MHLVWVFILFHTYEEKHVKFSDLKKFAMSEVFHHDISRDFYIFLMKKNLDDMLGSNTMLILAFQKKITLAALR